MQAESLKAIEICPTGSESPSAAEPEKQKKKNPENSTCFFLFNEVEHS